MISVEQTMLARHLSPPHFVAFFLARELVGGHSSSSMPGYCWGDAPALASIFG